jgi:hypothetical protein
MADVIPVVEGLEDMADLVDEVVPEEKEIETPEPKVEPKADAPVKKDAPAPNTDDGIPDDLGLEDTNKDGDETDVPTDEEIAAFKDVSKAQEACKALRTKIVELRKTGTGGEAAAALQARVNELEAAQAGTDLSQTPAYQETYVAPIKALGASISEVAEANQVDSAILRQALLEPDSKARLALLKSATDDNDTILELIPMMTEMDKLRGSASKAIADARTSYNETMATKAAAQAETQKALVESSLTELGKVHFLLRDSAKNPKWLAGIREAAGSLISGSAKPEALVEAALKAQVSDHYLALFTKAHNDLLAAQNQIDKLRGVRPRNNAQGGGDKGGKPESDVSKVNNLDELAEMTVG